MKKLLKPDDVATVQDIARRTGRKTADLVHYATLKLAPEFQALPESVRRALAESGSQDLWQVPDNIAKELKSVRCRTTTEIQRHVTRVLSSTVANPQPDSLPPRGRVLPPKKRSLEA